MAAKGGAVESDQVTGERERRDCGAPVEEISCRRSNCEELVWPSLAADAWAELRAPVHLPMSVSVDVAGEQRAPHRSADERGRASAREGN
jgi:hypothetical protein